jgi:hypothetical protein
METRLSIPKNWQDFEMLCHKLWRDIWADPHAQRNGRQGQSQQGVDIWGKPIWSDFYEGVQCKDKNGNLGAILSTTELTDECIKAIDFQSKITSYTVATTAPRDVSIQAFARSLTDTETFPFSVHVWSWEEIEEEIRFRPELRNAYYPDWTGTNEDACKITISSLTKRDQIHAFYNRPEMQTCISSGLRAWLITLSNELGENIFRYGKASRLKLDCSDSTISFEDDGNEFNPIIGLDPSKVSLESHAGSFVFDAFLTHYKDDVKAAYERTPDGLNRLVFSFSKKLAHFSSPQSHEVLIDLTKIMGRSSGARVANSIDIPDNISDLIIVITDVSTMSGSFGFLNTLLKSVAQSVSRISLSLPRKAAFLKIENFITDPRVTISYR